MHNQRIAVTLEEVADLLELKEENPFRVRAYRNAARTIADLPEQLAAILADPSRQLTDIKGVGADLAEKLETLITSGSLPLLIELQAELPAGLLLMIRVPGLGPKKAAALFRDLGISTLDQLREACEAGKVRELKGFGAKTEKMILEGLAIASTSTQRIYWAEADRTVAGLMKLLQSHPAVKQIAAAGSYRRGKETIGDLDFLVDSSDGAAVMEQLASAGEVETVIARGDTKMSVRLIRGLQVDLRVVPTESFGAALQYFTGSKEHNVELRGMAKDRGLKINEWGVFDISNGEERYLGGRTEDEVYAALGLPCFPPELREARKEFEWASEGRLPELITLADIRGDLHMHTTESDGKASLNDMVAAARARGLEYIAITDHSKRVSMANGLDGVRLRQQWELIDEINDGLRDFRVLKGVECDILERGGMDIEDEVLAEADWVIASVHYGQNQSRDQITKRIVDALAHPSVSMLAHPTGRLINRRDPYEVDMAAVIEAAAKYDKILEINSNPARLDLNDVDASAARERGVLMAINTDAHSVEGLGGMRYGVLQARRAGLTSANIANTRPLNDFLRLIHRK